MNEAMVPFLLRPSELARLWELHPKTVYLWIREGRLPAVRTPGDQFRLRPDDVLSFCEKNGLAVPRRLARNPKRLLLVGRAATGARAIKRALRGTDAQVESVGDALEGLFVAVATPPDVLPVDTSATGLDWIAAIRALRRTPAMRRGFIVAFEASSAARVHALERAGASLAFTKVRVRELCEAVISELGPGQGAVREDA
jgi:excisionase family DNA binding protein